MSRAPLPIGRLPLVVLALVIVALGGAWWWTRPPLEPVIDGKNLSAWIDPRYGVSTRNLRVTAPQSITAGQLHACGPAAVTWLAYWVEHGRNEHSNPLDPFGRRRAGAQLFSKAPDWLRRLIPDKWGGLRGSPPKLQGASAADALRLLGPEAAPAIPALERALKNEDHAPVYAVAAALQAIGPASWPVVERALARETKTARVALLSTLFNRINSDRPAADEMSHVLAVLDPSVRPGRVGVPPV